MRLWLSASGASLTLLLAGVRPLAAQTVNVTTPGSLTVATGTTTPASGAIWNLLSTGIFLNTSVMAPTGTPGLTVNGNGNTLTLNNGAGGHGNFFNGSGSLLTLNLSDITLTGGTGSDSGITTGGGAIFSNGPTTINGSAITLVGNSSGVGGAIYSNGALTINSSITLLGNQAANSDGGGIHSGGAITINGDVTANNNTALSDNGGAFSAELPGGTLTINGSLSGNGNSAQRFGGLAFVGTGNVVVTGSVDVTNNTTITFAGGAFSVYHGDVSLATVSGSSAVLSGNIAAGTSGVSGFRDGGGGIVSVNVTIGNANGTTDIENNRAGFAPDGTTQVNTTSVGGAINSNGTTTLNGSAITLSGNQATADGGGVYTGGSVTINGALTANSNAALNGSGGAIFSGGMASITGGAITLSGNHANSSSSFASGGAISAGGVNLTGSAVTLVGNQANSSSIFAFGGAINSNLGEPVTIAGGTITLVGNQANSSSSFTQGGAIASSGSVTIGGTGSAITLSDNHALGTSGSSGGAIFAVGSASITGFGEISNNTTTGFGGAIVIGATAPFFFNGNVTLTASGGNLLVSGNQAGGLGGAIQMDAGTIDLEATDGSITFSHNIENTAGTAQANAIYLGNTLGGSEVILNATAGHAITFFDPIQNNAADGLIAVTKTGAGAAVFDGSLYSNLTDRWSQVYGTTDVQAGTFAVQNSAVYGALAADVGQTTPSSFTLDSGVTLAGGIAGEVRADNFALDGTLNIAGAAPSGNASGGFSTFTVTSNNVSFGADSRVLFNTYLNDASVQRTDLLTLNLNGSATSGTASIFVTNVGGPGGLTTGNGIQLVQTDNGTTAGAFTLANPELRAGAFDYRLFQGGPDGSDPNNWYLRSTMIEPPIPPVPPTPIIGPELATYGVVQPIAQQLGRAMLGTHDDRMSDLYVSRPPCEPAETNAPNYTKAPVYTKAPTDCAYGWRPAVWGRLFGQQIDNHYQAFAPIPSSGNVALDPRASGQIAGLQAGVDLLRSDSLIPGHTDYAGFYAAYGNANVDVSGLVTNAAATAFVLQHTGHLNLNAYSGGAYWTHYGVPGWYLDLTLQGTSYGGGASTEFASLKTTGTGFISSLEGGYPIALPVFGPGFVLEPQAQVLWQWVSFDAGNDGLGPVALGTSSETTARLGLKGKWTITTDSGQVWQPYVRTNVWSDFGGIAVTMFGPDSVPLISHAQYMDVDAGFTTKINAHLSAFAEAGYQFAVSNDGGGKRDGVKGTAGLRYQW